MTIRRKAGGLAFVLAIAGSATAVAAVPANADAGGNASLQYCRSFAQFYPPHMTGGCTSDGQNNDNAGYSSALIAYFCKVNFLPVGEFATVGECVDAFNHAPTD